MVDRGALTPYFARDSKQYATAGRSSFTQRTTQKRENVESVEIRQIRASKKGVAMKANKK